MVNQGENGANPDGLASISTQSERKSVYKKHGSDNSFHPKANLVVETVQLFQRGLSSGTYQPV